MRYILKPLVVILVKYLQRKYKQMSIDNRYNQTNQVLNNLTFIQSILYWLNGHFNPWGYFHPSGSTNKEQEKWMANLFPQKKRFKELNVVVWHNPEAVTYYQNKIYKLTKGKYINYHKEIREQLIEWKDWY